MRGGAGVGNPRKPSVILPLKYSYWRKPETRTRKLLCLIQAKRELLEVSLTYRVVRYLHYQPPVDLSLPSLEQQTKKGSSLSQASHHAVQGGMWDESKLKAGFGMTGLLVAECGIRKFRRERDLLILI